MTPTQEAPEQTEDDILSARCVDDPYGFVLASYPWGVAGTELEHETGPGDNQARFLIDLGEAVKKRGFNGSDQVMPILMTATSGHGTGKSVLGAWIGDWILSTRPDSIGTVTAGTFVQLETRTWAALRHWTKLCITGHCFEFQARIIHHKLRPETWKIVAQTCKEGNAQSFAGQHARTSTSWYMFDEASLIPDKVWTVAQGGLSDGSSMFFAWGQMERITGRFYEINFGSKKHHWDPDVVAPSVITLNAMTAAQAANDFLFYMTGLALPDAFTGYVRSDPLSRRLEMLMPRRDQSYSECGINSESRFARGRCCTPSADRLNIRPAFPRALVWLRECCASVARGSLGPLFLLLIGLDDACTG